MICFIFLVVIIGEIFIIGLICLGILIVEIIKFMLNKFSLFNLLIDVVLILLILGKIFLIFVEINELVFMLLGYMNKSLFNCLICLIVVWKWIVIKFILFLDKFI